MRIVYKVAAITLMLTPRIAEAIDLGNPQLGLVYARETCAECHAIEVGRARSPSPDAPSFASVANTPGMTARALDVWLQSPHPTMPNLMIPTEERDNIIAYIMTLRAKR